MFLQEKRRKIKSKMIRRGGGASRDNPLMQSRQSLGLYTVQCTCDICSGLTKDTVVSLSDPFYIVLLLYKTGNYFPI